MDAHRHDVVDGREVGVESTCAVLKNAGVQVAPSSYYAAKSRPPSARAIRDAELVEDIKVAHKANLGVYGARKIHAELNREGIPVARCVPRGSLRYCVSPVSAAVAMHHRAAPPSLRPDSSPEPATRRTGPGTWPDTGQATLAATPQFTHGGAQAGGVIPAVAPAVLT